MAHLIRAQDRQTDMHCTLCKQTPNVILTISHYSITLVEETQRTSVNRTGPWIMTTRNN